MCCKLLDIVELQKPRGKWCEHCAVGQGCKIYDAKPPSCSAFACLWLSNDSIGDEWKPDKCKIVLAPEHNNLIAYIDGNSDIWRNEPYISRLRWLSQSAARHDGMLMVVQRGRTIAIYPDSEVDLGIIDPAAIIVTAVVADENGKEQRIPKVLTRSEVEQLMQQQGPAAAGPELLVPD